MPVIALCNQKGGCGKTTIALNLAQAFVVGGYRVALVDLDPQGSALDWAAMSTVGGPEFAVEELSRVQLLERARSLRREYDVVVIDCPPQVSEPSAAAVRVADLVLIPVQPSPFDVWASDAIVSLVRARQDVSGGQPLAAYVVSRAISKTALQRSLSEALVKADMPVLASGTTQRVAYSTSAASGLTVFHGKRSPATAEVLRIRDEVKEVLKDYDWS